MSFASKTEEMAFDKTGWVLIDTELSADNVKNIYMGKPLTPKASKDDPVWFIKKIMVKSKADGTQSIEITYAQPVYSCRWSGKEYLTYNYNNSR